MTETTAANPELLVDQVAQLLVQPLEAASVVLACGPRIFDTSGVLRIPKLVSGATVGFIGEGAEIPANADVDFDELILMPTDRKSLKTILTFTNELVRQSVLGIDAVLKARLVKDVSDALDTALLTGTGSSNSITGITEQDNTIPATLDVTDADSLLDAIGLLNAEEVTPNRWLVNGNDFVALRKLEEATDSSKYLLESDVTRDATYRLFGVPVTVTNKLPEGTAVLADFNQIAVARDLAPSITVLTERYAEFDSVGHQPGRWRPDRRRGPVHAVVVRRVRRVDAGRAGGAQSAPPRGDVAMLPLAQEVGVHTYTAGSVDAYGVAAPVYTPPLDQPGTPHKVYGWQVPSSTEPHDAGGHVELVVTEVELFAPPGFPIGPSDLVDLPDGQYRVIGHLLDYTHGPFGTALGVLAKLRRVEG